jgi:hypothetical protein
LQPKTLRLTRNAFGRARWDDTIGYYWTRADDGHSQFPTVDAFLVFTFVTKICLGLPVFSNLFPVSYERYVKEHMTNVRKCNLMPEEIFSEKIRMADDGTLCKTLFYVIRGQA